MEDITMRNLILAGMAVFTLGSCCFFGDYVEGDGNIIVREFSVGSFEDVELAAIGKVIISQGSYEKVTAVADENILERMGISDSGDTLVIDQDYGVILKPTQEPIFLVTMKTVERVHLTGAGSIVSDGIITADRIRVILEGAGDIQMEIDATEVVSVLAGAGDIVLEGNAPRAEHLVEGAGDIEAFNLNSNIVEAVIEGAGDIEVSVEDYLKAVIDGAGDIYYKGSPTLDIDIDGWGSVHKR